jgi:release factor glutamine methyltransferase
MKIKEYRTRFISRLAEVYDIVEAESFFSIVLKELKGWGRVDLAMNPDVMLTTGEHQKWDLVLEQLLKQVPVQYIFGKAHFYGMEFEVSPSTLIPRPETEELVEMVVHENRQKGKIKILDIGTGSGCIAVSLAKNLPMAQVFAIDVSKDALEVAKRNAAHNNVEVTFWGEDILALKSLPTQFDVIVSNPPYVRHVEKAEIKPNVLEHEPHLALFVEDTDPLLFYRKIAGLGKSALNSNGRLYFEINQYLGNETAGLLEDYGYKNVALKKDLFGNYRMISCSV